MESSREKSKGLIQPLLPRNSDAVSNDEETGGAGSHDDVEITESEEEIGEGLVWKDHRLTTFTAAVVDLVTTILIAFAIDGKRAFFDSNYTLDHSVVDLVWVTIMRTCLLMYQTSRLGSLLAAKISGYVSLLSLLFFTTKLCYAVSSGVLQWHDKPLLYAVLLLLSLTCCAVECLCVFLVGVYSSKDTSLTVAPTANEAAEGISVDEAKSIGLLELFKVLIPYFWPDGLLNRLCVFFTWVFLITSKASNIIAPLYIAKATDDIAASNITATTLHVLAYAGLLLSNKVFKEAQALAYIRVKLIAGVQLREKVFTHLLSLSMDWHQRKSMGAVITAMQRGINASNLVVQYLFLYLFPTGIEAVVVAVVFVKVFGAPILAACAICGCTLYVSITIELTIWRMQYRKRMNKADNDASHKVTDSLLNIETVKYFTAEKHEVQRYRKSVDVYQDNAYKIQGSLSLLNTTQQIVLNSTLVAALLVAAHEYTEGNFTIGQFVAVNVYVIQLFAPLNFLGTIYGMAIGSYVDLQNLCNMLAEKLDIQDREDARTLTVPPSTPIEIEFRDVTFSYPSRREVQVLKNISFIVPAGSTTAIVGETGSGKSTLTRLLFRFYEANQGQVLVGNNNVLELTQSSLRDHLGVVPQDHILFNDTLEYNIRYGARDKDDEAVRRAAEAAELTDFIAGLPKGLDTVVGERGQQVSGGQKQRIAIARVFMKESSIVVLDEATSSLDSRTEEQVQNALEKLRGRTMLIIAHRLSTIQRADQIIVMSNGEILERGTHETLIAKGNWHERCYASLWEGQKRVE